MRKLIYIFIVLYLNIGHAAQNNDPCIIQKKKEGNLSIHNLKKSTERGKYSYIFKIKKPLVTHTARKRVKKSALETCYGSSNEQDPVKERDVNDKHVEGTVQNSKNMTQLKSSSQLSTGTAAGANASSFSIGDSSIIAPAVITAFAGVLLLSLGGENARNGSTTSTTTTTTTTTTP